MAKKRKIAPTTRQIASELVQKAKEELKEQEESRLRRHARGFMDFVREQGVVGLAVGLALGTAATVLVKSLVDNIVMPLVGWALPGSGSVATKASCLNSVDGVCVNQMAWGAVVSNLISFLSIALVIYLVVKGLRLDRLDKKS